MSDRCCRNCGGSLPPGAEGRRQRFCCQSCRDVWHGQRRRLLQRRDEAAVAVQRWRATPGKAHWNRDTELAMAEAHLARIEAELAELWGTGPQPG